MGREYGCIFSIESVKMELPTKGLEIFSCYYGIERIVLLDFIHRLVSQKIEE
jgi:hypothetical protein